MFRHIISTLALVLILASGAWGIECTGAVCGIPWGTKPAQLEGFTKSSETPLMDFYTAPLNLELAPGVVAHKAIFGFGDQGLYVVYFQPETTDGYNLAMDQIMEEFGNPVIINEGKVRIYRWQAGEITIKAWRDMEAGERKLAFYNSRMEPPQRTGAYEKYSDKRSGFFPIKKGDKPESTPLLKF